MTITCRLLDDEIRTFFANWVAQQEATGKRLICIEGLMGAGKSYLLQGENLNCSAIDLDEFLPKPASSDRSWLEQVQDGQAVPAINARIQSESCVLVGGVVAWPILRTLANQIGPGLVRRIYIKRMSRVRDSIYWGDGEDLDSSGCIGRARYFVSIDAYHRDERPWKSADLVLERVPPA